MRVGVFGAAGRMGSTVCRAVASDPELELVAAVDPHHAGLDLRQVTGIEAPKLHISPSVEALGTVAVDVMVDFTLLEAARRNAQWCAAAGVHAVVGTSGFGPAEIEELRSAFRSSNCLIAPNFAIGAVLMTRFAELAAPYFESAEIVELHHDGKADAPSGTAMHTAARLGAASSDWAPDHTTTETSPGARGAEPVPGVRVHSVRMRGLVAHQEVLFGTTGQMLSLRHDSFDRESFMPGVVLAIKRIAEHPGLTVGLDGYLGF